VVFARFRLCFGHCLGFLLDRLVDVIDVTWLSGAVLLVVEGGSLLGIEFRHLLVKLVLILLLERHF